MPVVNVSEFRSRLPYYLRQVRNGAEYQITSHGKSIARLIPEIQDVEAARSRLRKLQGTMIVKDIVEPIEADWMADADNL